MGKHKQKFSFQVTFELEDMEKFTRSYPNFVYNYTSFEEWVHSQLNHMVDLIEDIEGYKLIIKQLR